ncbi:MAG: hypothetical protein A2X23_04345 [Chloroflexi bacterium GWC2_73_18]|nr:MAG: hypothetical protein A2X23_04345 [Chloroflexi bacterium GWC2_73_18]
MLRPRRLHAPRLAALVGGLLLVGGLVPAPAAAALGDIGYQDRSFTGASGSPSGSKPESKLWWNDGFWWASLFDTVSADFHIFRLDLATQAWQDTGVLLDPRTNSRADVLWDGTHLYVASHVYSTNPATGYPSRLYRFSYNAATDTYSLDTGFPVTVNDYRTETLVVEKDGTGKLWATWTQGGQVWVNRTIGNDLTWGTPFVPAVSGTSVAADDISSVIAFGPGKIGVMWSNQNVSAIYFAVHVDGQPDTTWEASRTAVQGPKTADDHVNLKSLQAGSDGRVFAAVKTSMSSSSAPLNNLLVRDPATGDWASYRFGRVSDSHTRPIVMLDEEHGVIHVFATGPQPPGTSGQSGGTIYEKTSPLDSISFSDGYGTPVINDADSGDMNNVTSTKQNVNSTTGLVVLATNDTTRRYWHAYQSLGGAPAPPVANFSGTPVSGTAPLTVDFTDLSSGSPTGWSWAFGDGGTSTLQNPNHEYVNPGTYSVTLVASNAGGDSAPATKTDYIAVSGPPPPAPVADFSGTPTSGVEQLSVDFTDLSSGSPTAWSWAFGDGGTSTLQNPSHFYAAPGTYTVSLTATNAGGSDPETKTGYVVVSPAASAPTADFSGTPTSGDAPLAVQFSDLSTGVATSWSWAFGDGGTSTLQNPSHTYAAAGTYTVGLTASNSVGGDTETKVDYITVSAPPAPTILTFAPLADAQVKSSSATTNYGSLATLRVREDTASPPTTYRSYLKFTVSGITGTVSAIKLRLFVVTQNSNDGGAVYAVGNGWAEGTITWNTAPVIGPTAIGSAGAVTQNTWVEITLDPGAIAADGTYSFALKNASTTSAYYNSREAATNRPQLVITQTP